MMFKPSLHGWGFADTFAVEGPMLGLGAAPDRFGLGGGMCWTALDRYLDGRAVPAITTAPRQGTPLHAELLQRQVAALDDVWPRVRQWQALPDGSWRDRLPVALSPGRGDVTSLTRAGWRRLRRSLAAGRPVLLTLVRPDDGYTRAIAARQVLAYACETAGATVTLSIYDPTRPGDDDVRLAFSRRGTLDARLTGGERVRGFFAVEYDRVPAPFLQAESFADRTVVGLNRKVRGRPQAAAGRRGLHLIARDGDGALIHFHRRDGKHWESANITEREKIAGHELHCDPAPLAGPGGVGLHAFSRSYVGDLLHFRSARRRWRVANRTEHRRAGARFRIDGEPRPVALPWGAFCIVGRGREGSLIAYSAAPFRGWSAEEVPPPAGGSIVGDPAVVAIGPAVHAMARGRNGHILHFERTKGGWSVGDLVTLCEGAEPVRTAPVLVVHEGALHAFATTADGRLLHFAHAADGQWTAAVAARGVTGEAAATTGPAGLHAFAMGAEGELVHAWRSAGKWRVEDVVGSRTAAPRGSSPTGGLAAWGAGDELRVFGRRDGAMVAWVWRSDTDWVGGPLLERTGVEERHQPAEDPLVSRDRKGGFHVFGTNGRGTVLHLESGPWRAATRSAAATASAAAASTGAEAVARPADAKQDAGADQDFELVAPAAADRGLEGSAAASAATGVDAEVTDGPEPERFLDLTSDRAEGVEPELLDLAEPGVLEDVVPATSAPAPPSGALPELERFGEADESGPEAVDDAEPVADLPLVETEAANEDEPFAWELPDDSEEAEEEGRETEVVNLEHMESWPKGPTRSRKKAAGAEENGAVPPWPEER